MTTPSRVQHSPSHSIFETAGFEGLQNFCQQPNSQTSSSFPYLGELTELTAGWSTLSSWFEYVKLSLNVETVWEDHYHAQLNELHRLYSLAESYQPTTLIQLKDMHMVRWQLVSRIQAYHEAYDSFKRSYTPNSLTKLFIACLGCFIQFFYPPEQPRNQDVNWTKFCEKTGLLYASIGNVTHQGTDYRVTARCFMPLDDRVPLRIGRREGEYVDQDAAREALQTNKGREFNTNNTLTIALHRCDPSEPNPNFSQLTENEQPVPNFEITIAQPVPFAGPNRSPTRQRNPAVRSESPTRASTTLQPGPIPEDQRIFTMAPEFGRSDQERHRKFPLDELLTQIAVELLQQNPNISAIQVPNVRTGHDSRILAIGGFIDEQPEPQHTPSVQGVLNARQKIRSISGQEKQDTFAYCPTNTPRVPNPDFEWTALLKREAISTAHVYFGGRVESTRTTWDTLISTSPILHEGAGVFPEFSPIDTPTPGAQSEAETSVRITELPQPPETAVTEG